MRLLNWLGGLVERRSAPAPRSFDEVMDRLDGPVGTIQPGITTSAAMQVATVMACARLIANGCATPTLRVLRELPDGRRQEARNIPEHRMLSRRPNEWQTSLEWRRTMTLHAVLTEGALSVKVKAGNRVRELIPVRPGYWQVDRIARYDVTFRVWDEFGPIGVFDQADVFYLPNFQWDVIKGLSAVSLARSAIGLAVAAEANQSSLHQNGGRPAGLLTTEKTMSQEAVERIRAGWGQFTRANRNGTAILDGGMKYIPLAMSGVDGQHLETRRFQVEEICRAFDVFPSMIGHADKATTYASAEAFFAAHLKHTLAPWHEAWRQRLDEFVLDGAGPLFVEFDTRYLSAGSMRDRAAWARTMAELGIYTRNELRDEEGKDPLPGLDEPLTPMNMTGGAAATGTSEEPADDATA